MNLGTCYLKTGNMEGAMEQFGKAVQLQPRSAEAHYNLGAAYMNSERYGEASALFRRALEIDPGHRQAAMMLEELEAYQAK
jgi:Flp pilus assembly protein TadD